MASGPVPRKQKLLQQIDRSARLKVINELKRTQGLAVSGLAERLQMSYMGVKGVCLDLEKRGLLDTWRQPQKLGRPQMLYRLTERAQELFPSESNGLTLELLEAAQRLFGTTAPEKLLLVMFQKQKEKYAARVNGGSLEERVEQLTRVRRKGGVYGRVRAGRGGLAGHTGCAAAPAQPAQQPGGGRGRAAHAGGAAQESRATRTAAA